MKRYRASERVANILGLSEAPTLLSHLEEDGERGEVARRTVSGLDSDGRRALAMIKIADAIDSLDDTVAKQNSRIGKIERLQNEPGSERCRQVERAEMRFWKFVVIAFVTPIVLWLVLELAAKRLVTAWRAAEHPPVSERSSP